MGDHGRRRHLWVRVELQQHAAGIAAVIPTVAFWVLDTYFLRTERLFRALYDEVRSKDDRLAPFFMGATGPTFVGRHPNASSLWKSAKSLTIALVYGGLLLAAVGVA